MLKIFYKSTSFSKLFAVLLTFSLVTSTLSAVKPPELHSEYGAYQLKGSHPSCGSLSNHYQKTIQAYDRYGSRQITKANNGGHSGIEVIYEKPWDTSTVLAVVKGKVSYWGTDKVQRAQKEPLIYELSKLAGLDCIVPSVIYKRGSYQTMALEVFTKFLPENTSTPIPAEVREFYNLFSDPYGTIGLCKMAKTIQGLWSSQKQRWKTFLLNNLDVQSLQEVSLAHMLFNLGDLYLRNVVLRWGPNGIRFYTFDTAGCENWNGSIIADSMGVEPRSNEILDLCLFSPLTEKSRAIVQTWHTLSRDPDIRTQLATYWPVSSRSYSAYSMLTDRATAMRRFVSQNSTATVGDLYCYGFLGANFSYRAHERRKDLSLAFLDKIEDSGSKGILTHFGQSSDERKPFQDFYYEVSSLSYRVQDTYWDTALTSTTGHASILRKIRANVEASWWRNDSIIPKMLVFFGHDFLALPDIFNVHHFVANNPSLRAVYRQTHHLSSSASEHTKIRWEFQFTEWAQRHWKATFDNGVMGLGFLADLPSGFNWLTYAKLNPHLRQRYTSTHGPQPTGARGHQWRLNYATWLQRVALSSFTTKREKPLSWLEGLPSGFNWESFATQNPELDKRFKTENSLHLNRPITDTAMLAKRASWLQRIAQLSMQGKDAGYSWLSPLPARFNWNTFARQNPSLDERFRRENTLAKTGGLSPAMKAKRAYWLQRIAQLSMEAKEAGYCWVQGLPVHFNWKAFADQNPELDLRFKRENSLPLGSTISAPTLLAKRAYWLQRIALLSRQGKEALYYFAAGLPTGFKWQNFLAQNPALEVRFRKENEFGRSAIDSPRLKAKFISWIQQIGKLTTQGKEIGYCWITGLPNDFSWAQFLRQNPYLEERYLREQRRKGLNPSHPDFLAKRALWLQHLAILTLQGKEGGYSWLSGLPTGFNWKTEDTPQLKQRYKQEQLRRTATATSNGVNTSNGADYLHPEDFEADNTLKPRHPIWLKKHAVWIQTVKRLGQI